VDNRYNLNHISYDKNGNIKNLLRNGFVNDSSVITDNLTYNYATNSNVLEGVSDASNQAAGFNDGSTSGNDYTYDANGNMKTDANKQITSISYNHLNLPAEVGFENSNTKKITYSYDATGVKLKKVVTDGSTITTTDYAGNYTYKNDGLEFFNHVEGYVEPTDNPSRPFQYVYQFKDHLGNIRLSYSDDDNDGHVDVYRPGTIMSSPIDVDGDGDYKNEIRETKSYYPFGLTHDFGTSSSLSVVSGRLHKYGFVGKEYQDELNLNMHDFGARNYMADIGRWGNIDPLAETYVRASPYNYALNSPIMFMDPDGMKVVNPHKKEKEEAENNLNSSQSELDGLDENASKKDRRKATRKVNKSKRQLNRATRSFDEVEGLINSLKNIDSEWFSQLDNLTDLNGNSVDVYVSVMHGENYKNSGDGVTYDLLGGTYALPVGRKGIKGKIVDGVAPKNRIDIIMTKGEGNLKFWHEVGHTLWYAQERMNTGETNLFWYRSRFLPANPNMQGQGGHAVGDPNKAPGDNGEVRYQEQLKKYKK